MFPILTVLKPAAAFAGSIGAGTVAGTIIKTFVPTNASRLTRASFAVGSLVLTSAAASQAEKYVAKQIDETAQTVQNIKTAVQTAKSE